MAAKPPRKSIWHNTLPRILLSLVLAGGFAWLLARGGLPLLPPREQLAAVPGAPLAGYALLVLVAAFLRTYRWNYLVRPIAPRANPVRIMSMSMVGFSAVFLLPLRSGELLRPYLLAKDGELSFMQAAGTVAAERVILTYAGALLQNAVQLALGLLLMAKTRVARLSATDSA